MLVRFATKYDPDQPRWPRGTDKGGQWRDTLRDMLGTNFRFLPTGKPNPQDSPGDNMTPEEIDEMFASHPPEDIPFSNLQGRRRWTKDEWVSPSAARRIEEVIGRITGRPSAWSGGIYAVDDLGASGLKEWGCEIYLDGDLEQGIDGPFVLIHEMFHAHSAGATGLDAPLDYAATPGLEEGVVESLTVMHAPAILREVFPDIDDQGIELMHDPAFYSYFDYVYALDTIVEKLEMDHAEFLKMMINTPLKKRNELLLELGRDKGLLRPPYWGEDTPRLRAQRKAWEESEEIGENREYQRARTTLRM